MTKTATTLLLAFTLGAASATFAGGPKSSHPCYNVADCKSQTSKKDFSACIKEHEEDASANPVCSSFRNDEETYLKLMGMESVDELFE
ncbi:MAG: hypothetical protein DSZ28_09530 [Thiothrix sp.]|nr:MAG: hypothetical protein DSZ28_09530 [Thiothrix sp.]